MKKIKLVFFIIFLFSISLTLCGCSNKKEENKLEDKINSEIEYLDKKIIGIMNKLNNITLENYEVKTKEMSANTKGQEQSSSGEKSSNDGSSGGGGSESGGGSSSEGDQGSESTKESIKVLQLQPSNILVTDKNNIDWMTIKSEIEVMYTSWDSILLDLYSKNINSEDILRFSKLLDDTILMAKSEDKTNTLIALANLYGYLPKYVEKLSIEESKKNLLQTKSHLMNAYVLVEQDNWEEVQNQLNQADEAYGKIINDVKYIENNQEKTSIIYVLIKELKNSISTQDKDIFYIKYKSIMNEMG